MEPGLEVAGPSLNGSTDQRVAAMAARTAPRANVAEHAGVPLAYLAGETLLLSDDANNLVRSLDSSQART
jgi:hypothetical protein